MFDVDALGRHEAKLLREEAARIADTETALQSVLDGDVVVPLIAHRETAPGRAVPGRSVSVRRRMAVLVGVAAGIVTLALVATRHDNATPADQPSMTTLPRPLPDGSGAAPVPILPGTYFVDEVAGISTPRIYATLGVGWTSWSDGWHINKRDDNRTWEEMARDNNMTPEEATSSDEFLQHDVGVMEFSRPVAVYLDACHWEDGNHPGPLDTVDGLTAALTTQRGWAEVSAPSDISIDGYVGKTFQRIAPTDMSDCTKNMIGPRTGSPGLHPDFKSWENPVDPPGWAGYYYEPGWIETLWVLDLDGTIVVITTGVWPEPSAGADADFADDVLDSIGIARDSDAADISGGSSFTERLVRPGDPPIDCGFGQCPWSPELTARTLDPKFACSDPAWFHVNPCVTIAVSPGGTLVAFDASTDTLTWYEDEPRVVPLADDLLNSLDPYSVHPFTLGSIGPHDIAYLAVGNRPDYFVAVDSSGAEITRVDISATGSPYLHPTATGSSATSIERLDDGRLMPPNSALWMPWVDFDGNPITDTRPYPNTTATDAGLEVRLGERQWLIAAEEFSGDTGLLFYPQSDGGIVVVLLTYGGSATTPVFYLSTDDAVQHYSLDIWPSKVLPDGSLIVEYDRQLVLLTPTR
jgi:hypothetical protein